MTHTLFRHAMTAFHHVGASFHGAPTNISAFAVEKIPRRRCRYAMTPLFLRHAMTATRSWHLFVKAGIDLRWLWKRFHGGIAAME